MRFPGAVLFLTRLKDASVPADFFARPGRELQRQGRRRVTFLEILLALSLVSILAGSLYATYAAGLQIHKRAQKLEQWSRSAFWSFDAMARDLENMLPYHSPAESAEALDDFFEGTSSGLKLLCAGEDGLIEVRYFLQEPDYGTVHKVIVGGRTAHVSTPVTIETNADGRVQCLVREERPFPSGGGEAVLPLGEGLEILNRYVLKDSLKFFFAETSRGAASDEVLWEPSWEKPDFPSLVRIEMTLVNPQDLEETVTLRRDVFIPAGAWK
ncbi:MAG TPA: hypothetical protein PK470_02525 [Candidatus Omnitrophota bacterium]|nr:hypothetical protein [Candidatus Omnitrophota bacterium]